MTTLIQLGTAHSSVLVALAAGGGDLLLEDGIALQLEDGATLELESDLAFVPLVAATDMTGLVSVTTVVDAPTGHSEWLI